MALNYTTNLSLGLPVTGTESMSWGDDVNNATTAYLDIAISGGLAITITTADVTLSNTQGNYASTNIGSTTAQYAILNISGAMTAARNLILPSSSRQYVINNNTTGGFALTVKGAATTGVTMVNGESSHIYWNGSDYAKLSNATGGAGSFTSITNSGLTAGRVVYSTTGGLETDSANLTFNGTTLSTAGLSDSGNLTFTGTGNRITGDFSNATIASRVAFQTSTTNGATAITAIPNGTSAISAYQAYSGATANESVLNLILNGGNYAGISSTITGTGTYLPMTFYTGGSERMRLDTSGNVGIGTSSPASLLHVDNGLITTQRYGSAGAIVLRSAAGTQASPTAIASSTGIGTFVARAYDGSAYRDTGAIQFWSDGAVSSTSSPGFIIFNTTPSGSVALTERMRIDSSGNVGIGVTPSYKLDVYSSTATVSTAVRSAFAGGSAQLLLAGNNTAVGTGEFLISHDGSANAYLYNRSSTPMIFGTSNTERMRLDSSGNLGIGTASPTGKLDVRTAAGTSAQMNLYSGSNATQTKISIGQIGSIDWDIGLTTSSGNFLIGGLGGSVAEAYRINRTGTSVDYQTWSTSGAERMRIDSSGRLLVNLTTSKVYGNQLQVVNGINAIGSSSADAPACYAYDYNALDASPTYSSAVLRKFGSTAAGNLYFASTIAAAGWAEIGGINVQGGVAFGTNSGVPIIFTTTGTERMRIDSSGNVGIGTSSPADKLQVVSSSRAIFYLDGANASGGSGGSAIILRKTGGNTAGSIANSGSLIGDSTENLLINANTNALVFSTGAGYTERMRIDSSGNVLVGTTTAQTGAVLAVTGGIQGTIKSGTAVASTSGMSIDFTSIPSWVKRITVMFNGVSTNGTSQVRVRIGPSGGVETSGYLGVSQTTMSSATNTQSFTAGFDLYDGGAAAAVRNGMFVLALLDAATNTWTAMANIGQSNEARMIVLGGVKPLAGTLSIVRITTVNGTDIFDAGSINILYEG